MLEVVVRMSQGNLGFHATRRNRIRDMDSRNPA
jgi:hypothetical protein